MKYNIKHIKSRSRRKAQMDIEPGLQPNGRVPEVNRIICGNFVQVAADWPGDIIDLTVTSPPYVHLRDYNGYDFNYKEHIETLYRVTKPGGVVVWVVGDQTVNGGATGMHARQSLYFRDVGFLCHDTIIYKKHASRYPATAGSNRYSQIFEKMYIFCKDRPPKTADLICDKENRRAGQTKRSNKANRRKNGELVETTIIRRIPRFSPRNDIWEYKVGGHLSQWDKEAYKHPATFPIQLAIDHIKSWSNPGDLVLDGMVGSGTTCIAAKVLRRNYIGVDISLEYCELARRRLARYTPAWYEERIQAEELKGKERRRQKAETLKKLTPKERELLGFPGGSNYRQ